VANIPDFQDRRRIDRCRAYRKTRKQRRTRGVGLDQQGKDVVHRLAQLAESIGRHDGRQGVAGANIVDGHASVDFGRRVGLPCFRQHVRDGKPGLVVKWERGQNSLVCAQGVWVIAIAAETTRFVPGLT